MEKSKKNAIVLTLIVVVSLLTGIYISRHLTIKTGDLIRVDDETNGYLIGVWWHSDNKDDNKKYDRLLGK